MILDILLPGVKGQELLKEFRKGKDTPVLMMTAIAIQNKMPKILGICFETEPYQLAKRIEASLTLLDQSPSPEL